MLLGSSGQWGKASAFPQGLTFVPQAWPCACSSACSPLLCLGVGLTAAFTLRQTLLPPMLDLGLTTLVSSPHCAHQKSNTSCFYPYACSICILPALGLLGALARSLCRLGAPGLRQGLGLAQGMADGPQPLPLSCLPTKLS